MGAVGANVGELRNFAVSLQRRAEFIEGLIGRLGPVMEELPWVGQDRDRFIEEWQQVHQKNFIRLVLDLRSASTSCAQHADEQERVSSVDGFGGGSFGGGGSSGSW